MAKKNLKKVPLFITTALFFATPICLAEAANAQVNGADGSYSALQPGIQQLQKQQVSALGLPAGSFLGQTPQTIRSFKFPILSADITLDDVILLQSRLTIAESQLRTLKATTPRNPQLKAQIDELISQAETQVLNLSNALKTADSLYKKYQAAAKKVDEAATQLQTAAEAEALALEQFNAAKVQYENAQETLRLSTLNRTSTEAFLNEKLQNQSQAASAKLYALEVLNTATLNLEEKTAAHTIIQGRYDQALALKNAAQTAYDTELIPDPTWTPPTHEVAYTRQVEHTREVPTTQLVQRTGYSFSESSNILPSLNATQWSGAGTGFQGSQPTINDGVLKFSYMNQTVSYTANANLSGTLALTVDFRNLDANRGQQDTYEFRLTTYDAQGNVNGAAYHYVNYWHDWMSRTIEVNPSSPVTSYKVDLTGLDAGFWYGTYGPEMRNPRLSGYVATETTYYEEVTTYVTETYYTTETYYVTEPITSVERTMRVEIGEGGRATFTAPAGATFTSSNLRYESYSNPQCGRAITPTVNGLTSVTLQALNSVWGDPCGGQVKHITGTLTYLSTPTAPLINDPSKLPALTAAQAELLSANEALTQSAQEVSTAETATQTATTDYAVAQSDFDEATEAVNLAHTAFTQADEQTSTASTEAQAVQTTYETATTQYETAKTATVQATSVKQEAEAETEAASTSYQSSVVRAKSIPTPDDTFTQVAELQTKEPEPEPTKEELPEEITAEAILETDLSQIDPTTMTEEQAEQLKEAALEIFETAEEGSAEYEQALDALYLAAEQDDIVLDPALAAIPGLAAATELVNFLGNAGADMSPAKREESKKVIVTAVVAAGAAIQSAAAAAASAIRR